MEPASLKYLESHEWVAIEGEIATIGISAFAVEQLTDLVYVELPAVGKTLEANQVFGEVESVKAVSDLYSPVSGEVVEVNDAVAGDAAIITNDPFGAGWLIKVRVTDQSSLDQLLNHDQYQDQIAQEQ